MATRKNRDYAMIKSRWCDSAFTPQYRKALHDWQRAWVERQLMLPFRGQTVVVTHHPPTYQMLTACPDGRPALGSMDTSTHRSTARSEKTRVVCNAKGVGPLML